MTPIKYEVFRDAKTLRKWFEKNHKTATELHLAYFKKDSGKPSVNYSDSVDEALCFGWIDGVKGSIDEVSYSIRFTPRRSKSIWSKINVAKVAKLVTEKRMTSAGMVQVESAKSDGRWEAAYEGSANAKLPDELATFFVTHPKEKAFWNSLNAANRYAFSFRLMTARTPETKKKRLDVILSMLRERKAIHSAAPKTNKRTVKK
jgi:uncharacterized protein YdeI (YjbR/CyaY-like superfamily)